MMELQQLSPPKPPKQLLPFPQQQQSRRRMMIQLHPLSFPPLLHPHPQSVAAKSLMKTSVLSLSVTGYIYIFNLCRAAWTVSEIIKNDAKGKIPLIPIS
jgi:hypothetical protein